MARFLVFPKLTLLYTNAHLNLLLSTLSCTSTTVTVFVLLTLVFGFFMFANFSPVVNYAFTAVAASACTVLSHA